MSKRQTIIERRAAVKPEVLQVMHLAQSLARKFSPKRRPEFWSTLRFFCLRGLPNERGTLLTNRLNRGRFLLALLEADIAKLNGSPAFKIIGNRLKLIGELIGPANDTEQAKYDADPTGYRTAPADADDPQLCAECFEPMGKSEDVLCEQCAAVRDVKAEAAT